MFAVLVAAAYATAILHATAMAQTSGTSTPKMGSLISAPNPVYPAIAKAANVEDTVVLHATISKTGTFDNVTVVIGNAMLRASALDAVQRWKATPYLADGVPIEVEATITVLFSLNWQHPPAKEPEVSGLPLDFRVVVVPARPFSDGIAQNTLTSEPKAGAEILSDTMGVDFSGYIRRLLNDTRHNWDALIPAEAQPPQSKKGIVGIRITILPDGKIGSMTLETRSGNEDFDKAAWNAIVNEVKYPALPQAFHGSQLELRIGFFYNTPLP
jgi:TonB family protein